MPRKSSVIAAFLASTIIFLFLFDGAGGDVRPLNDRYFKNPSGWRLSAFTYMIGVRSSDADIDDERPVLFMFQSFMRDTGFISTIYDSEIDVTLAALGNPNNYLKFSSDPGGQDVEELESCEEQKIDKYFKIKCEKYNGSTYITVKSKSSIMSHRDFYMSTYIFCPETSKSNLTANLDELRTSPNKRNSSCGIEIKENGVNLIISIMTEREAMHIINHKDRLFAQGR